MTRGEAIETLKSCAMCDAMKNDDACNEICDECAYNVDKEDKQDAFWYAVNELTSETKLVDIRDVKFELPSLGDPVNHPSHYTDGKIEVIDFIEDKKLPFHLGNAVKYISRAGKKDPNKIVEDLEKAVWYLNRYIDLLEKEEKK